MTIGSLTLSRSSLRILSPLQLVQEQSHTTFVQLLFRGHLNSGGRTSWGGHSRNLLKDHEMITSSSSSGTGSSWGWMIGCLIAGGLALMLLSGVAVKIFAGPPAGPTTIVYASSPAAASAPTILTAPAATPPALFGGATTHHHYAAAIPPAPEAPVVYSSGGYEVAKRCAWTDKVSGFTVSAPSGGRDALNAASTANDWRGKEEVAHHWAQQEAAKNPPPRIITNTVYKTVPVVIYRPVPFPVIRYRYYPHYPWW